MRLTAEQEAALAVEGARVAIAAGAGSGKTTLLCEAIWRDVEGAGIALDQVFVATYNRAAAAHLIGRLQGRFGDGRGADRAGLDLSAAWVGTFHSLCARIVREHPFAAEVDPEFGELDDAEAGALADRAFGEALGATAHDGLTRLLASVASTDRVRGALVSVHERLRAAGMERPSLVIPDSAEPDPRDPAEAERLLDEIAGHPDAKQRHERDVAIARVMLRTLAPARDCPTIYGHGTNALKELIRPCKELLQRIWHALLEEEALPQLEGFAALLEAFSSRYAALKAERGALDYEDLQLAARRVLRGEHPYRFSRVYVDEFQDANAVQNEIIDLLRADRVVVVGDGTQAIYRFRHADATHFLERVRRSPGRSLVDNHRSNGDLLSALNGLLGRVLKGDPSFSRLSPMAVEPEGAPPLRDPALEVITVRDELNGRPTREQEASVLADVVGELTDHGYAHNDIVVLFRALTQVGPYRGALDEAGIPHHLVIGQGFFAHDQVADVLSLLRLVENPRDELALVRALASPYVAASDAELVAMRRSVGFGEPLIGAADDVPSLGDLLAAVDAIRSQRRAHGLAGTVEAAIAARGYELAVLGLAEGERRYANLRKLVRLASSFEAVRGPDLRGFLGWVEAHEALGVDPGEATLVDPGLDAVALMTIHGAKGQEFPVVILADASHGTPGESRLVLAERDGRAGIAVRRPGGDSNTPVLGLREIREAEAVEADAEERRLLYVALTRAQRHAVVIGRAKAGRGSTHHRVLLEALEGEDDAVQEIDGGRVAHRVVTVEAVPEERFLPEPSAPATTEAPAPVIAPALEADLVRGRRLSFTALSTLETCARRFHLEYERGLRGREDAVIDDGTASAGAVWSGADFGTLVHEFLARHDWAHEAEAGWAARAATVQGLPASAVDEARAERLVSGLVSGPIGDRVRRGSGWFERPYGMELDGALLFGAIDLMLDEADGRVVVYDWKTHVLQGRDREELEAAYRLQMAMYGLAALRAGAREVELLWVFLEDLAHPLTLLVGERDVPALEDEVRGALAGLRRLERPPASDEPLPMCSRCPGLAGGCPVSAVAPKA